jgi:pyrroline-5-carboxylate reductase
MGGQSLAQAGLIEGSRGDLVLVGCGKMGSALLTGWLDAGLPAERVVLIDPFQDPLVGFIARGCRHAASLEAVQLDQAPLMIMLAVKPQMMAGVLAQAAALAGPETLILSIAAGIALPSYQAAFGQAASIVRLMPNTPAAIGHGITGAYPSDAVSPDQRALTEALLRASGPLLWLDDETLMHAVTAISGSGPAYVFHMIEAMTQAAQDLGLTADLALQLAKATVAGAGQLAVQSDDSPAQLRINVTSPKGTTEAGLAVLMGRDARGKDGLGELIGKTAAAAYQRSVELADG